MINDQTILSSFDDKPTLLEWLKKVEDALKTDTATAVSVENPSANTYVFKITFADGDSISSGNVVFPDSVKDVSIKNGHIIVTMQSGTQTDLGEISGSNPYADIIVINSVTNTTEIENNVEIAGETKINAGLEVLNELDCSNIVATGAIQSDTDVMGNRGRFGYDSYELVPNPNYGFTQVTYKECFKYDKFVYIHFLAKAPQRNTGVLFTIPADLGTIHEGHPFNAVAVDGGSTKLTPVRVWNNNQVYIYDSGTPGADTTIDVVGILFIK